MFGQRLLVPALTMLLAACSATGPRTLTVSRVIDINSPLTHGADSVLALTDAQYKFASTCLSGSAPQFWARYFNQTDLPERKNRASLSFTPGPERAVFKAKAIKLLPVFAQNTNNLGEVPARTHGVVNASDLIRIVGAQTLIDHLQSHPLYVVLNEETPNGVLSVDHYKGWIDGFTGTIAAIKANAANIRPIVYGNINADPELKEVLRKLHANRDQVPYAGFWRALADKPLQGPTIDADNCGRLANWVSSPDWDDAMGAVLIRQYVLQARGAGGASIDLDAVNPQFEKDLLDGMLTLTE
jgi:hypothetical protein